MSASYTCPICVAGTLTSTNPKGRWECSNSACRATLLIGYTPPNPAWPTLEEPLPQPSARPPRRKGGAR